MPLVFFSLVQWFLSLIFLFGYWTCRADLLSWGGNNEVEGVRIGRGAMAEASLLDIFVARCWYCRDLDPAKTA